MNTTTTTSMPMPQQGSASGWGMFSTILIMAGAMLGVDLFFGLIALTISENPSIKRRLSYVSCFAGGFLMICVLQMLYESHMTLVVIFGEVEYAFVLFGLGLIGIGFLERWAHIVTSAQNMITPEELEQQRQAGIVVFDKQDVVKSNIVTIVVLISVTCIENVISSFSTGAQTSASSLINMGAMIVGSEPIQTFVLMLQFKQSRAGMILRSEMIEMTNTPAIAGGAPPPSHQRRNVLQEIRSQGDAEDDERMRPRVKPPHGALVLDRRSRRELNRDSLIVLGIVSLSNTLGIFMGFITSHVILGEDHRLQNACSGSALAFVAGVFFFISYIQMVYKELEDTETDDEFGLIKKGCLIVLGLASSVVLNTVLYYSSR